MGELVNAVSKGTAQINRIGLLLLLIFFLQAVFSYFRVVLFVSVTESMAASIRRDAFNKLLTLPMKYYQDKKVTEINSRLASDISQVHDTFTTNTAEFLRQLIIAVGGLVALFFTSVRLSLVMLATIPLVAILAVIFGRRIRKLARDTQDTLASTNAFSGEVLSALALVKSFTNEKFEKTNYYTLTERVKRMAVRTGMYRGAFFSFIIFCLFGSIVLLIWYAMHLQLQGMMTQGEVIKFILYTLFVGASIGGISEQYSQIQKALGATQRIFAIIEEKPEERLNEIAEDTQVVKLSGDIRFEKVSFFYPSRPEVQVLSDVSFHVRKGEMAALVGSSGAGKSTIASLILHFYEPSSGSIYYDDKPMSELSLKDIRAHIAYVPQDVFLFSTSIRENIRYGNPLSSEEEMIEAARMANAHDFIMGLPKQYDTVVGERGIQLSGGQRQRIAIARAILKNPSLLLLDEATSSLDSESELMVQQALDRLMEGRTSVVIAHRLSTIRKADKIIVLDKGRVVEVGRHEELLKNENGLYHRLYKLQEMGISSI